MKALIAAVLVMTAMNSMADDYVTVYVPNGMKVVLVPEDTPEFVISATVVQTVEPTDSPSEECEDTLTLGPGDRCSQ